CASGASSPISRTDSPSRPKPESPSTSRFESPTTQRRRARLREIEPGGMVLAVEQARSLAFATDVDSTKFLQTVAHKLHQAIPEMKGRSSHARSARIAPLSFSTATGDYTQNPRS